MNCDCRVLKVSLLCLVVSTLASACIGSKTATVTTVSPTSTKTTAPCASGPFNINVSWIANREKAVNTTGGGYLVYYSTTSPVDTSTAPSVDVPYASGATAPTSKVVTGLTCGTWYFKTVAYSAIHPSGSTGGSRSPASAEVTVTVP